MLLPTFIEDLTEFFKSKSSSGRNMHVWFPSSQILWGHQVLAGMNPTGLIPPLGFVPISSIVTKHKKPESEKYKTTTTKWKSLRKYYIYQKIFVNWILGNFICVLINWMQNSLNKRKSFLAGTSCMNVHHGNKTTKWEPKSIEA